MTSEAAPSGRLYVHIGAPKTGTSYLQSLMWADRDRFREAGVHLPGKGQKAHFAAGGDLLGKVGDDYLQQVNRDHKPGAWDRLAAKIRRSDSPGVLVTDERLSGATPDAIARVAALGTDRTIHVVFTVRSLGTVLPSAWQTAVKHGSVLSLEAWLHAVLEDAPGDSMTARFWRVHDLVTVLERWREAVDDAADVHVVTVPAAAKDPGELWRRFASVVGLPAQPPGAKPRPNRALDYSQVEMLRRLNTKLGQKLEPKTRRRLVRNLLATRVMGGQSQGRSAVLPAEFLPAAVERTNAAKAALGEAGYDVVGNLDDLDVLPVDPVEQPTDREIAEVAEMALAGLVHRLAER